jgi:predicted DNA-binding transcriptional regulator YafY
MMRVLASREVTIRELADQFQVTPRQIRRDLQHIEADGHPLEHSKGERAWWLPLNYPGMRPITVSPDELMSLYFAKSHLTYLQDTPFWDNLKNVIDKVEAGLPSKTANHLERIMGVFALLHVPKRNYAQQKNILSDLQKALRLQRSVTMLYRKPGYQKATKYPVDPYTLALYEFGLYLIGYSHGAGALRTFALERIKSIELTDEQFEIPKSFSLADRMNQGFGLIENPPQEVRIQFSPDVAHLLKERQYHPTQRLTSLRNGGVLLRMNVGVADELVAWVLSWGAAAKVLSPPDLIKPVAVQLNAAQKLYSN